MKSILRWKKIFKSILRWRKKEPHGVCEAACTGMGTGAHIFNHQFFQIYHKHIILSSFTFDGNFFNICEKKSVLKNCCSFSFCRSGREPGDSSLLHGALEVQQVRQAVCHLQKMREDQVRILLGSCQSSQKDAKTIKGEAKNPTTQKLATFLRIM